MEIETPKSREIKRLTEPLNFKNSKAYDSNGNLLKCSETISDVRFIVEPEDNLLNEQEILQYAPQSKSASKIRLKKGFGNLKDILLIHESLPWISGLFYTVLICIAVPIVYTKNMIGMYAVLVLIILPLLYMYYIFNLKRYGKNTTFKQQVKSKNRNMSVEEPAGETTVIPSLIKYGEEINNLTVIFNVKEDNVRKLIEKRFEPPQITYDKFISTINNCHKLFYEQSEAGLEIIRLASEDTAGIQNEIKNKINILKTIINQIEDLTNELVINITSSEQSADEVKNLLEDMENLIDSVKEY